MTNRRRNCAVLVLAYGNCNRAIARIGPRHCLARWKLVDTARMPWSVALKRGISKLALLFAVMGGVELGANSLFAADEASSSAADSSFTKTVTPFL